MQKKFQPSILQDRAIVKVTGDDRFSFCQGMFTQDVGLLTIEHPLYACYLTPQGRYLIDFFIFQKDNEDCFYLDCPKKRVDSFLQKIRIYKLRAAVSFELCDHLYLGVGEDLSVDQALYVFKDPRHQDLGNRYVFQAFDALPDQADDYRDYCVSLCIPQSEIDLIPEQTTMLEARMDELNAISWKKGCYIGQELTARMKYRGLLKRKLFALKIKSGEGHTGEKVFYEDKEIGVLRSIGKEYVIAHLKIDAYEKAQNAQDYLKSEHALYQI